MLAIGGAKDELPVFGGEGDLDILMLPWLAPC